MAKAKATKKSPSPVIPLAIQAPSTANSRSTVKLSYEDMIVESIRALGDTSGSSMIAIKKYMSNNFELNVSLSANIHLKRGLDKALDHERIVRLSGKGGLTGSFRLVTHTIPKKRTKVPTVATSSVTSGPSKEMRSAVMKKSVAPVLSKTTSGPSKVTTNAVMKKSVAPVLSKTTKPTLATKKTTAVFSIGRKSSSKGTKSVGTKKSTVSSSVGTSSSSKATTRGVARKQPASTRSNKTPVKVSSITMKKPAKKAPTHPPSASEEDGSEDEEEKVSSHVEDETGEDENVTNNDANETRESLTGEATLNSIVEQNDMSAVPSETDELGEEEEDEDDSEDDDSEREEDAKSVPIKTEVVSTTVEMVKKNIPSATTHDQSEVFDNTEADTQLVDADDDVESSNSQVGFHGEETNDGSTYFQHNPYNNVESEQVTQGESTVNFNSYEESSDNIDENQPAAKAKLVNETGNETTNIHDDESSINDTSTGDYDTTGDDGDNDDDESRFSEPEMVTKARMPLKKIDSPEQQQQMRMVTRDKLKQQVATVPPQQQKQDALTTTKKRK